jgi:hypothetical protein
MLRPRHPADGRPAGVDPPAAAAERATMIEAMRDFEQKLHILEHTYPAWSIRRRPGSWIAVRVTHPTQQQSEVGARHFLVEPTLDSLVRAMDDQLHLDQEPEAVIEATPRAA